MLGDVVCIRFRRKTESTTGIPYNFPSWYFYNTPTYVNMIDDTCVSFVSDPRRLLRAILLVVTGAVLSTMNPSDVVSVDRPMTDVYNDTIWEANNRTTK